MRSGFDRAVCGAYMISPALLARVSDAVSIVSQTQHPQTTAQIVSQARLIFGTHAAALWHGGDAPYLIAADSIKMPSSFPLTPLVLESLRNVSEGGFLDGLPDFTALFVPIPFPLQPNDTFLIVYFEENPTDDSENLAALTLFAAQVAPALERARLYALLESIMSGSPPPAEIRDLPVAQNLAKAIALRSERETERLKSEFVSTISHELRTPLTIIKGYGDLLSSGQAGDLSELQHRFLDAMQKNTARLTELLNDLLDISQIEQGRMKLQWNAVDMARLVTDTCADHSTLARERDIALELATDERIPPVAGDFRRIRQALNNLLGNALKYSPAGSQVTVFCQTHAYGDTGNVEVITRVQDTGEGIPDVTKAQIFDKFYRVDSSLTREVGGSGLGLAIAKEIVLQHNGRIWVEDAPGGGSLFAFALPVSLPQKQTTIKDGT